ncbi:MAG TPA: hypothetical protein VGE74_22825, partial [Gemmata sp.]
RIGHAEGGSERRRTRRSSRRTWGTEASDEAEADVPDPRYEQIGNRQRLICDEQEWLARPAAWGIQFLSEPFKGRSRRCSTTTFIHDCSRT